MPIANIILKEFDDGSHLMESHISAKYKLRELSLRKVLKELDPETELARKCKSFLLADQVLTTELITEVIKKYLVDQKLQDVLICDYPYNNDQFIQLEKLLSRYRYVISKIWNVRIINPSEFLEMKFSNVEFSKVRMLETIYRKREAIDKIYSISKHYSWNTIKIIKPEDLRKTNLL